jgi:hypothetical protein
MSGHPDSTPRHGFRFRLGIPAEIYAENRTFPCEARNISRSGALIVGKFPTPATPLLATSHFAGSIQLWQALEHFALRRAEVRFTADDQPQWHDDTGAPIAGEIWTPTPPPPSAW